MEVGYVPIALRQYGKNRQTTHMST
jgi:hypothetical protein